LDAYDETVAAAQETLQREIRSKVSKEDPMSILLLFEVVMQEPEYQFPTDALADAAFYILSRNSGEGKDRTVSKGDFQLTDTEIRDIKDIASSYDRMMLVLNVCGVVDLTPVLDDVPNILLLSQPGMAVGDAFADVILGKSFPSGKLSGTWAKWEDYCQVGDFGEEDDTRYREGIYVGYRYFDTMDVTPSFPFGYGLSYTTFSFASTEISNEKSDIMVRARVENTGRYPGKETMQLYVAKPSVALDQPYQVLAAFAKTEELLPGENQTLELKFDMASLASFDAHRSMKILEKGDYTLLLGRDSRATVCVGMISLNEEICVEKVAHVGGEADFEDLVPDQAKVYLPQVELNVPVLSLKGDDFTAEPVQKETDVPEEILRLTEQMSNEELAKLCVGGYIQTGSKSIIGAAGIHVAGAAGETTSLEERGIRPLLMADRHPGVRVCRR
ncbi:MAG: glycoside hydrolase family 3 C-terminal domain-containing protein, partial [Lachnospiraceae bacterium]|nr:glycoside hydrolase family 3 C-terminal domain-containing protein [Lachnospiraceae bacterium]